VSGPSRTHISELRAPDAEMSDTPFAVREGSLRSDYQHLYPGIQAGVWYIVATLTSAVGVGQEPATRGAGRVLSDLHFQFRGGDEAGLRPRAARTGTEDTLAP
jgi:hypothetical protein